MICTFGCLLISLSSPTIAPSEFRRVTGRQIRGEAEQGQRHGSLENKEFVARRGGRRDLQRRFWSLLSRLNPDEAPKQ